LRWPKVYHRFERFTYYKPPALPEVADFRIQEPDFSKEASQRTLGGGFGFAFLVDKLCFDIEARR